MPGSTSAWEGTAGLRGKLGSQGNGATLAFLPRGRGTVLRALACLLRGPQRTSQEHPDAGLRCHRHPGMVTMPTRLVRDNGEPCLPPVQDWLCPRAWGHSPWARCPPEHPFSASEPEVDCPSPQGRELTPPPIPIPKAPAPRPSLCRPILPGLPAPWTQGGAPREEAAGQYPGHTHVGTSGFLPLLRA